MCNLHRALYGYNMGTVIKDGEDYVSFAFEVNQKIVTLREKELQ
jgi:hypothetical protein